MVSSLATRSSTRISRAALIAITALFAALLVISRAALGAGHGGSGHGGSGHSSSGHSGSVHSGGSSHVSGSGSHGGGFHGGSSHGGTWRGTSFQRTAFHGSHVGGFHGGGFHGGFHGGGFRHVGFPFFGWNWWGWGWGWGWAPYYSSWWWWGGPGVYVVADDGYANDGYANEGYEYNGYGYGGYGRPAVRAGRYAVVKTDVSPEEAQVFLDGKYIGTADDFDGYPDFLYLGPGKYHLEFRLPGYQMYTTDLDVSRGQRVRLDQKLKLEPGKSALDQFPPQSKGTPLGRVFTKGGPEGDEAAPPAPPRRAQQPYGRPSNDGWSDRDVSPGDRGDRGDRGEREERIDLRPEPLPRASSSRARMRFKVTPEDAAVYVDDKYLGAGEDLAANPRGVVTDPGTHSITVARPGYKTKTVDVTVRVGAPVDVVVELEK